MRVAGDYDSDSASLLLLRLNRCDSSKTIESGVTCKSEEEITSFFRNKYMFFVRNQKVFNSEFYG